MPLIEIVTKPIEGTGERAPEIARAYVTALRDLLRALGVSDVRMDQGSMRCDSNVSLKPTGANEFGTRTETKNVNSLKSVEVAVRYEMRRQAAVLDSGGRSFRRPATSTRTAHLAGPQQGDRAGLPLLPRARSGTGGPRRGTGRAAAGDACPSCRGCGASRIQDDWGISDEVMRDLVNAGALDLVAATVEARRPSDQARAVVGKLLGAEG